MGEPRLSVALCTYEGERYLPEQLASIAAQSRTPDELVVGDDGSTDTTVQLLEDFAAAAPFPVTVLGSGPAKRLGTAANFERTLAACSGDLVALADQDDRWESSKLARLVGVFASVPEAQLAFSDARLVDEAGRAASATLWATIGFDRREQQRFTNDPVAVLLRHPVVTGCTVVARAALVARALPFPAPLGMVHDQWLSLCAAASGALVPVAAPLVAYRVHPGQQVGIAPRPRFLPGRGSLLGPGHIREVARPLGERFQDRAMSLDVLAERFEQFAASAVQGDEEIDRAATARAVSTLAAYRRHLARRDHLPASRLRRVAPVLDEMRRGGYRRFSAGPASALVDLIGRWGGP